MLLVLANHLAFLPTMGFERHLLLAHCMWPNRFRPEGYNRTCMANDRIPSRALRPSQRGQHGDLKVSFANRIYSDRLDRVDLVQTLGNGEA